MFADVLHLAVYSLFCQFTLHPSLLGGACVFWILFLIIFILLSSV